MKKWYRVICEWNDGKGHYIYEGVHDTSKAAVAACREEMAATCGEEGVDWHPQDFELIDCFAVDPGLCYEIMGWIADAA